MKSQLKANMMTTFTHDKAWSRIRDIGPLGDDKMKEVIQYGHNSLALKAPIPIHVKKLEVEFEISNCVKNYFEKINNDELD